MPAFESMVEHDVLTESEYPAGGPAQEQFRFLLRYAILAPSTFNTQPWKFSLSDEGIAVFADYTRRMPVADPGNRELLMSVGAAILNLRAAAAHFGFACHVSYNYNGDSERPLAFATLGAGATSEGDEGLRELFPAIALRRTNRNPFLVTRIPSSVLGILKDAGAGTQVRISISTDGSLNQKVGDLVAAAERTLLGDMDFRKDNAEWTRTGWSSHDDGVPGGAVGLEGVAAALAPWATKVIDFGRLRAARDKNLCIEAPGLVVLSSEDSVPHFLETGEVLERVLLILAREGLQTSYFNMPMKSPEYRVKLRGLLGLAAWPQLLLRIGFGLTETPVTPRRPVDDVIVPWSRR